jgi:hypothetical protein
MSGHTQAEQLALAASIGISILVTFHCELCSAEFSNETRSVFTATRKAVTAGWRVDAEDRVHCPDCAKKLP